MIYESPHPDVDVPEVSLPSFILDGAEERTGRPALIDGPRGRTTGLIKLHLGFLTPAVFRVALTHYAMRDEPKATHEVNNTLSCIELGLSGDAVRLEVE